jgi:hypothetical protein
MKLHPRVLVITFKAIEKKVVDILDEMIAVNQAKT